MTAVKDWTSTKPDCERFLASFYYLEPSIASTALLVGTLAPFAEMPGSQPLRVLVQLDLAPEVAAPRYWRASHDRGESSSPLEDDFPTATVQELLRNYPDPLLATLVAGAFEDHFLTVVAEVLPLIAAKDNKAVHAYLTDAMEELIAD